MRHKGLNSEEDTSKVKNTQNSMTFRDTANLETNLVIHDNSLYNTSKVYVVILRSFFVPGLETGIVLHKINKKF